jgi:hypothetical protein
MVVGDPRGLGMLEHFRKAKDQLAKEHEVRLGPSIMIMTILIIISSS